MKLRTIVALSAATISFGMLAPTMASADDHAYTEGSVLEVSYIRTEPGMFDTYMKYLQTTYKTLMEEEKKAGIILGYSVFGATPKSPADPDLILTIEFKNMAALDGLDAKVDPLEKKAFATLAKASEADAARGKIRTVLGSELIRELKLK